MIRIKDIFKSFGKNEVLKGISLDVRKGEIIALVGGSGTGKSVLIKIIAGLLRPDRGQVILDGEDLHVSKGKGMAHLREKLGFLFQAGALFDSMTLLENVTFPLTEKTKLNPKRIRDLAVEELENVGLAGAESKFPSQLSGGMIKRAALARALVTEPQIMLFDEPTSGLDPLTGLSILELIDSCHKRLRFSGIIVTHETRRVFDIVDRVALLHDGKIHAIGTPREMTDSKDSIVKAFIGAAVQSPRSGPGRDLEHGDRKDPEER
jgi:phospholipid/cholesterol/gamma-HCH transport system ATP-binding protein